MNISSELPPTSYPKPFVMIWKAHGNVMQCRQLYWNLEGHLECFYQRANGNTGWDLYTTYAANISERNVAYLTT
jgi:hypothetical protein